MPGWQRIYLSTCSGIVAFAVTYMLSDYGRWPRLTYAPYRRSWSWVGELNSRVPMQYLGTALWGLLGGLVAFAIVSLLLAKRVHGVGDRALGLAGAWALSFFLLAGCYFTWNLWPF